MDERPNLLFEGGEPGGARLRDLLTDRHVDSVDVVGIATVHCVRATAFAAAAAGFRIRVLLGLCAGGGAWGQAGRGSFGGSIGSDGGVMPRTPGGSAPCRS